ncbi:type II/IV secretion system ATPase subunit [Nanoarchaeota archaeon]
MAEKKVGEAKPEDVKSEDVKSEDVKSEDGKSEDGKSEDGKPEEVKPVVKPVEDVKEDASINAEIASDDIGGPPEGIELGAGAGIGTGIVGDRKTAAEVPELTREEGDQGFYIDLRPKVIKLPAFTGRADIDIRYPLIPPYAYAHIFLEKETNELVYYVEEPILDATERELLELVQLGLEEMINISFVRAVKSNMVLKYLEKNVQSILIELGTKISKNTYKKIMYYIYRNSVGLNEIEPLLNDYYVEDIECNGNKFPLYIVHRIYQNIRTNVIFNEREYLTDFVEKLAQKAGRYISYAKPLLDGTLPDGSRVNATYSEDITTRGPTFTIRKFTKDPWSPIHLIKSKTASASSFAFLWLIIEHKFNFMTVGETASGKTTFLNSAVSFIPPEARIVSIEDTRELNLEHINWLPAVTRSGFGMPNVLGQQFGEINLFDLLRESFRQNPDYVIVGEIRGKEAYVLFQGMASGHPSFSTFHAAGVNTLVKRLETPPINLSPSLVESLDIVCVCIHVKDQHRNFRRLKEIDEIQTVEQGLGKASFNAVMKWDPVKDEHVMSESTIFKKIVTRSGMSLAEVKEEFRKRADLLQALADKEIVHFKDFAKVINDYYKDPDMVLKQFGIK